MLEHIPGIIFLLVVLLALAYALWAGRKRRIRLEREAYPVFDKFFRDREITMTAHYFMTFRPAEDVVRQLLLSAAHKVAEAFLAAEVAYIQTTETGTTPAFDQKAAEYRALEMEWEELMQALSLMDRRFADSVTGWRQMPIYRAWQRRQALVTPS